jgi:hypothetical protein
MPSLSAVKSERCVGLEVRSLTMNVVDPPHDLQDATPRESAESAPILGHAMGHGLRSPPGA